MTKGIILSGGWGTRLRPLTCVIPKTLSPIVNKPVMERQILLLKEAGVKEVILAVSVMSDSVKSYFKDGKRLGIKIHYTEEKHPMGTAGAVKLAEDLLGEENFFMLNGDVILNFKFSEMLHFHIKSKGIGTIAGKVVDDPSRFGVLIIDKETNQLIKFLEKEEYQPLEGKVVPMPINAGVYILEPEIFTYIPKNKKMALEREIFPILAKKNKLYHFPIQGIWNDVGKPLDLLQGNILLMNDLIKDTREDIKNLVDYSADIHPSTKIISPCVIGEHSVIRENCEIGPNVIIGDNVFIDSNSKLKESLIYNETYISKNVEIEKVILSDNCNVKENCVLKGNDENLVILASYVEVLNNIRIIAPYNRSLTFCHHEVVKENLE